MLRHKDKYKFGGNIKPQNALIAIGLLLASSLSSGTEVSGDVWGTWSADNNPYEVVGNLRVPPESTLVIEAGCYIEFQGIYEFMIDSSSCLRAIGSAIDSIIFTASDTAAGWLGLRFHFSGDNSSLVFCKFKWGKTRDATHPPYDNGGALSVSNAMLSICNSIFEFNDAFEGKGGAIFCVNSDISISDCEFNSNQSGFGGAALWCDHSTARIINNNIEKNISYYDLGGEFAGAIGCIYSNIYISDNIFFQNGSGTQGGAIFASHCIASILENNFSENWAWSIGAALYLTDIKLAFSNNLIINNYDCLWAGGLYFASDSIVSINNNTFYGNSAAWRGGGIYGNFNENNQLLNNIIYNNQAGEGSSIYSFNNDSTQVYYSNIEGGWPGEGNIDLDPRFVDPDNGDFHLLAGSPCIDAGDPHLPLDPDGTRSDMGAFYYNQLVGIEDDGGELPLTYNLSQNYPNPFNISTMIKYELPTPSQTTLGIYDILGRRVATLYDGPQAAGFHQLLWNADDLSSGVYFYKLTAGDYTETKKMLLVK